jgi:hypothetical protein
MRADHAASIAVDTGEILDGKLPPVASRLVKEWVRIHRKDLEVAWKLMREGQKPPKIEPLK